jgi:iron complex transport system substrate-binding protein
MPTRIIAQEDAAAALWSFGIRPIATYGYQPLSENPQFEGVDVSGVDTVGEAFGEINIEKIPALDPDLIVTSLWPSEGPAGGGFRVMRQRARVPGRGTAVERGGAVALVEPVARLRRSVRTRGPSRSPCRRRCGAARGSAPSTAER